MATRYELAFAPPGVAKLMEKGREAIVRFSSETPFHAFQVGDLVNPTAWEAYDGADCLKVTLVEHLVARVGPDVVDGVVVYTVPLEADSIVPPKE
jgi:hypothetical protein